MLKIKNLSATIRDTTVLTDIDLEIKKGEIHALIGPKHSGKSSLIHAILGNPILEYKKGSIIYNKRSILKKNITERNLLGIFTIFQFLPVLDGITNFDLTKEMLKAHKDKRNLNEIEKEYKSLIKKLGLSSNHRHKTVNDEGMTSTECRKNEILQMFLLNPEFIILDELEKDLESDELELIASCIKEFLSQKNKSAIIVTHNFDFLDMIEPTHVNIIVNGEIRIQGTKDLYKRIIKDGYTQFS